MSEIDRRVKIIVITCVIVGALVIIGVMNALTGFLSNKDPKPIKAPLSDAVLTNKNFVNGFFNYTTQPMRYKQIQANMTPKGFHDTFPSGSEEPKEGTAQISSSLKSLTTYENVVSETEKRYLNEILATTSFNGVTNSSKLIIKTTLVLIKGEGWKVDGVENVSFMDR